MSKLIDLDQHITVPITDDHGTYTVEITVGEFFKRFLPGEQLKVVDAVPVEWLEQKRKCSDPESVRDINGAFVTICIDGVLVLWQKEQEAR